MLQPLLLESQQCPEQCCVFDSVFEYMAVPNFSLCCTNAGTCRQTWFRNRQPCPGSLTNRSLVSVGCAACATQLNIFPSFCVVPCISYHMTCTISMSATAARGLIHSWDKQHCLNPKLIQPQAATLKICPRLQAQADYALVRRRRGERPHKASISALEAPAEVPGAARACHPSLAGSCEAGTQSGQLLLGLRHFSGPCVILCSPLLGLTCFLSRGCIGVLWLLCRHNMPRHAA